MPAQRRLYVGPSLRRLRRDLGLTQADMASDLEVSASYVALLERNHRPLSAEMLLRLAQTYKLDMATLAGDASTDIAARLQSALKDPMFADIDPYSLSLADKGPGFYEGYLKNYQTARGIPAADFDYEIRKWRLPGLSRAAVLAGTGR